MADDGIFATNAQVLKYAGANVDSTYSAVAYTDVYLLLAEAYINMKCETNYSATGVFAALTTGKAEILTLWSCALAGINVISANMTGSQLAELQTRVSILNDIAQSCEKMMTEEAQDKVNFLNE